MSELAWHRVWYIQYLSRVVKLAMRIIDHDDEGDEKAFGMVYSSINILRWIRTGITLIQEKCFLFWKQFYNIFII